MDNEIINKMALGNLSLPSGKHKTSNNGFKEKELSKDLETLIRFQTPNYKEDINFGNENLRVSRYDENISSFFQCDNLPSYIIIEKKTEFDVKTVRSFTEYKNKEVSSTPKRPSDNIRSLDLDLTGSPLECHFLEFRPSEIDSFQISETSFRSKFPVNSYFGFPVETGRYLSGKLLRSLKTLKRNELYLPPIWIACDGKDSSNTVFVGLHLNTRVNSHLHMTNFGPYISQEDLPLLDRINSHFAIGSFLPRVNSKVEAVYEVLSSKEQSSSMVSLHCTWASTISTFSSPGLDASTTAILQINVSDNKSRARSLYREFEALKNFIDGASNNLIKWYQVKEERALDRLLPYLQSLKNGEVKIKKESNITLDEMVEGKFLEMRANLEFPDVIWNILRGSQSFCELSECFKKVFEMISLRAIRPKIHVQNSTKFAVICRNLMRGQCQIPSLNNDEPIEMLIEIGLEKIKKDYISIFQVCDLVSGEQLIPYTNWSASKTSHVECLSKLEKLHMTLQVVIYLRVILNIPNSVLSHLTSKTLSSIEQKSDLPNDFEFQLKTSLVKPIIDSITPSVWIYETWSESGESPGLGKHLKFLIKKDENWMKMEPEDEVFSPVSDKTTTSASPKFFCLSVTKIEDIF